MSVAGFSPRMGKLKFSEVGHSTDTAGRLAKRVARRDRGQFVIGI